MGVSECADIARYHGEVLHEKRPEALFSKWGSTTHFNIVDRFGNAFNTTVSNGEGCGPWSRIQM